MRIFFVLSLAFCIAIVFAAPRLFPKIFEVTGAAGTIISALAALALAFGIIRETFRAKDDLDNLFRKISMRPLMLMIFSALAGGVAAVICSIAYILQVPPIVPIDLSLGQEIYPNLEVGSEAWWAKWWEERPHETVKFWRVFTAGAVLGFILNCLNVAFVLLLANQKSSARVVHLSSVILLFIATAAVAVFAFDTLGNLGERAVSMHGKVLSDDGAFGSGVCKDVAQYVEFKGDKDLPANKAKNSRCDVGAIRELEIVLSILLFSAMWLIFVLWLRGARSLPRITLGRIYAIGLILLVTGVWFAYQLYDPLAAIALRQDSSENLYGLGTLVLLTAGVAFSLAEALANELAFQNEALDQDASSPPK